MSVLQINETDCTVFIRRVKPRINRHWLQYGVVSFEIHIWYLNREYVQRVTFILDPNNRIPRRTCTFDIYINGNKSGSLIVTVSIDITPYLCRCKGCIKEFPFLSEMVVAETKSDETVEIVKPVQFDVLFFKDLLEVVQSN